MFSPCTQWVFGPLSPVSWSGSIHVPSAASLSAPSFPSMPACPFTHCSTVLAVLALSQAVVHLKSGPCFIPIQSFASQSEACLVSPSIANLESLLILSGRFPGVSFITRRIASSSATWLDCFVPGTRIATFHGSPVPYHIKCSSPVNALIPCLLTEWLLHFYMSVLTNINQVSPLDPQLRPRDR